MKLFNLSLSLSSWRNALRSAVRWPVLIIMFLSFAGCEDNVNGPKGRYENGIFVVNEGKFMSDNGSITFFDGTSPEQNIYKNALGSFAGSVAQSLKFVDNKGYLVLNGEDKIEVMDGNTMERIESLNNAELDKPRHIEIIDGKAYVSVWGPYEDNGFSLIDSYVLVIDLSTKNVLKKIETDEGTDNMLYAGNMLFASNNNFGGSKTLAAIDPSDNTLVDQIELTAGPAGLVEDSNGKVWVICQGAYGGSDGKLYRINSATLAIEQTIELNLNPNSNLAIMPDKKTLIYSAGSSFYKIAITDVTAPTTAFFTVSDLVSYYAHGVNPDNGDIFIGDALDYNSAGRVYVYDQNGAFRTSFESGISPTQFVFK